MQVNIITEKRRTDDRAKIMDTNLAEVSFYHNGKVIPFIGYEKIYLDKYQLQALIKTFKDFINSLGNTLTYNKKSNRINFFDLMSPEQRAHHQIEGTADLLQNLVYAIILEHTGEEYGGKIIAKTCSIVSESPTHVQYKLDKDWVDLLENQLSKWIARLEEVKL